MNATNLVDRLRDHVQNQPDATVYVSDASAVSFKQLDERANQLAHALLANGIVRGSRVAILSRSQLHSAVLILATMKIGACCVPVNWRLSAQEIRYIVEDATASIVVCDSEFLPQVESATIDLGTRLLLTDGATDTAAQIDAWSAGFDTTLAEGLVLMTPFCATVESSKSFVDAYTAAYGTTPNQFAADAYDGVYIVKAALEAAGCTADMSNEEICDALVSAMTSLKFTGLTGTDMSWNAEGQVSKAPTAYVVKDGQYVEG